MDPRRRCGIEAEQRAAELLRAAGCLILARNFRCRGGELDVVARRGDLLIVAEVRVRRSAAYGGAAGSITAAKCARIVRATRYLLLRRPDLARLALRFDVLLLTSSSGPIEWIENAF
ncbi:MAG: YraN family protein [Steroidobacteraceae bacterium]